MKHRRPFHDVKFDSMFVFHVRNDIKMTPVNPMCGTILHSGLRAITVVVIIDGKDAAYGIARCEHKYQFCRKLARTVALGRAKQALWHSGLVDQDMNANWRKQGTCVLKDTSDIKEKYFDAKLLARKLIGKINDQTEAMIARIRIDRKKKEKVVE